ncbi:receptor-like protein 6 [Gossypium hirsutum]|uniref:Receptor-like protein 6 n=1 Tax=Gossypium hirsutum TaxID=3635 RepID=A0A1U8IKM5_GOSHI|nr:receptor-like protein 6 [Gossypium hirsutum]
MGYPDKKLPPYRLLVTINVTAEIRTKAYIDSLGAANVSAVNMDIKHIAMLSAFGEVHIPSHKMDPWDEGTNCCKWEGVMCDNKKGNVIGLDLSYSRLIGSLQPNSSLFSLQNLVGNDLGISEIPSEFGKLRSLTYLNLSGAGFTGFIPPEISLLSDLVSLDLSLNFGLFFVGAKRQQ